LYTDLVLYLPLLDHFQDILSSELSNWKLYTLFTISNHCSKSHGANHLLNSRCPPFKRNLWIVMSLFWQISYKTGCWRQSGLSLHHLSFHSEVFFPLHTIFLSESITHYYLPPLKIDVSHLQEVCPYWRIIQSMIYRTYRTLPNVFCSDYILPDAIFIFQLPPPFG
jgi:hypothetical protein